jgi:hypothetical protein
MRRQAAMVLRPSLTAAARAALQSLGRDGETAPNLIEKQPRPAVQDTAGTLVSALALYEFDFVGVPYRIRTGVAAVRVG